MTIGDANQPGVCWTVLSDRASRAMAYVGMTRGRDENHLAVYPTVTNEAADQGADVGFQQTRRGTKHTAARNFRAILANDDRPRTMHTIAEHNDRAQLPAVVADVLDRNDQRRAERIQAWCRHTAKDRAREAAFQRITIAAQRSATRERRRGIEQDHALEL